MIPIMAATPWLVLPGLDPAQWSYALGEGRHTIGRHRSCQVRLVHPTVSNHHAEIHREGQLLRLRDLGSRNGTFIDDVRVQEGPLEVGQHIRMGLVKLEVVDSPGDWIDEAKTIPLLTRTGDLAPASGTGGLSSAQLRVLQVLLQGFSEKQIAQRLHLSKHTVHAHLKTIYKQLGVHSRAELMSHFFSSAETARLP
jgi:DNA-binding CsgD family transcriptional regulator